MKVGRLMIEPYAENREASYETIVVERDGRVGIVRWNRPGQLNAMSRTLQAEWIEAYDTFNEDPSIGAVVTTGIGRAYSSGADIGEFEQTLQPAGAQPPGKIPAHAPFAPWYMAEGKPTIAAVNGVAIGIGLTSILWHDGILASTNARFSARFAAIGLTPELLSSWVLPKIVGLNNAREMLLTGRIWTAAEAKELGLVREVVEPDDLMPRAVALAAEIASNPDRTLRTIKRMVMEDLLATDLSTIERRSVQEFAAARLSVEHREGLRAFREKRPPRFHDRDYMSDLAASVAGGSTDGRSEVPRC